MIHIPIPKWGKITILGLAISTLILLILPYLKNIYSSIKDFINDIDDNFDNRFGI